ncbi:MAG TPA: hypothetical protein VL691_05860 [Vicinamibacteria bacterium]|nr:hypothetical protein [Vicinamibacteria bacterium]
MRFFWAGFLVTGLFFIGLSAFERRQAMDGGMTSQGIVTAAGEDGTPMPPPCPPPKTK